MKLYHDNTKVLFKNDQWMVLDEPRGLFLVEVLEDYPEDLEGGYYLSDADLRVSEKGYTSIHHVSRKSWIRIQDFEEAYRKAVDLFGVTPEYDIDEEFKNARDYISKRSEVYS